MQTKEANMKLYSISRDRGQTWTTQWLTTEEALDEERCGSIVLLKKHLLSRIEDMIGSDTEDRRDQHEDA